MSRTAWTRLALLVGLLLLAAPPAAWLLQTWFHDGYGSDGEWVFLLAASILIRSATSKRTSPVDPRRAVLLFTATALVRFAGELLAIRVIGALALVIDVYAIGLALGIDGRERAASPFGVAALFALSLPIERLIQRGLGYPLQLIATNVACRFLTAFHDGLTCDGVLVRAEGTMLSIDLPCSGARGLVLLPALALTAVALRRVRGRRIIVALGLAIAGALAANIVRVFLLVEGVLAKLDVLSEPWHSLIGLAVIGVAAIPVLLLAAPPERAEPSPARAETEQWRPSPLHAALMLIASVAVHAIPARPIDASGPVAPIDLPRSIGTRVGRELPLTELEAEYFTEFGGIARKVRYLDLAGGVDRTVIAVRTRAPLRHLHADECLIGLGHRVERLGISTVALPTAVLRSTDPSGRAYRVEMSFVSERGERATSVAQVAWLWIRAPGTAWTMISRITDWDACERDPRSCASFTDAIARSLDLDPRGN